MTSNNNRKKASVLLLTVLLGILVISPVAAQKISTMEFVDIPITEILIALVNYKKASVIFDQTVTGNASFSIRDRDVDEAMNLFLAKYDLFVKVEKEIYYVSKIKIEYDAGTKKLNMDANDVVMRFLIDAVSKAINKTIQYDTLPTLAPGIHANQMLVDELLQMILIRVPEYKLEVYPNYYYIRHVPPTSTATAGDKDNAPILFEKKGAIYNVNQKKKSLQELVRSLFNMEGLEYNYLVKRAVIVEEFSFKNKTFEELLNLLLEIGNADYTLKNDIYYIFEIDERDVLKDYKTNYYKTLEYLSPTDIQRIMPNDLSSSKYYRIDQNTNTIILSGSQKEIAPLIRFIEEVDKPLGGNQYYRYDLNYVKAMNIRSMLPFKYRNMEIITIPETNSILMLLTPNSKKYMDEFLMILDKNTTSFPVTLKYIKSEDLMKNVPPAVFREDLIITGDPSVIFFKGTPDKFTDFQNQLAVFDKPVPLIRYEILVISYLQDAGLSWREGSADDKISFGWIVPEAGTDPIPGVLSLIGNLNNLLNLNFDFPGIAGITAALNLNAAMNNSNARVMTDTALYGLSGQKLNFQDTETFRYQTKETDNAAGQGTTTTTTTVAGATRELVTGLTLNIEGWVSGDKMITMNIGVTIKKQGTPPAENLTNLGVTYDKVVTTSVRVTSGQPIKVSGLIKQDIDVKVDKVPILGDIPILGVLFQRRSETLRKTEVVVYILPHIEKTKDEMSDVNWRLEDLYKKYVK